MSDHRADPSNRQPSVVQPGVQTPAGEPAVEDLATPLTPEQEDTLRGGLRRGGGEPAAGVN